MPAYFIIDVQVIEPTLYADYIVRARPILERHGARYLARGGAVTPVAGDWRPERIVLIEFPSTAALQTCLNSPEYRAIRPLRERAARTRAIVVEA